MPRKDTITTTAHRKILRQLEDAGMHIRKVRFAAKAGDTNDAYTEATAALAATNEIASRVYDVIERIEDA